MSGVHNFGNYGTNAGNKLELRKYDVRFDSKGERILLQTGKKYDFHDVEDDGRESAMVVINTYTQKNSLTNVELIIRSPHIITALREVIDFYPDINFEGETVVTSGPAYFLFHYHKELASYGNNLVPNDEGETAKSHINFVLQYMKNTFASDLEHYKHGMLHRGSSAGIDWERLWMAYRPGEIILCRDNNGMSAGRLVKMTQKNYFLSGCWELQLERVVCTGSNMAFGVFHVTINKYSGLRCLEDLRAYPIQHHHEHEIVSKKLIERGQKLFDLCGVHQKYYRGHAGWARDPAPGKEEYYEEGEYPTTKFHVRSRIMVDVEAFDEHRPNHKITRTYSESKTRSHDDCNSRSNQHYIICHTQIFGFSLTDKRWCAFDIDLIQDVEYSGSAFNTLLLPTDLKATLLSLVEVHTNKSLQFGDLVHDKGKGMIFLLHGEPGTGKTLTAESISDYVERPLYPLRSGDLGISAESLEASLSEAFTLGERWNAIILLDEADVFLETRRRNELLRNSLVSVFLRALEYYEGIMFLTTNRIDSFDPAFKSRIHLSMKYPPLCREFRRELWSHFIENGISDEVDTSVQEPSFLNEMSEYNFNGRQIRNVVRTAYSLAVSWGDELSAIHINTTLSAMSNFDNLDEGTSDVEQDHENSVNKSSRKRRRES